MKKAKSINEAKKQRFVKRLAKFLVGNQVGKGIALSLHPGLIPWAREWAYLRGETPISGYPTEAEAEEQLRGWLNIPKESK